MGKVQSRRGLLLSPPCIPRYNRAIEAGTGSLRTGIFYQAAQNGRSGNWTSDDADAARELANHILRPWGVGLTAQASVARTLQGMVSMDSRGEPEFYLTTAGESTLLHEPRACWRIRRLDGGDGNEYLLVEIYPPVIGPVGLGGTDVSKVILSKRGNLRFPGSPVTSRVTEVNVIRVLDPVVFGADGFDPEQVQVVAWGLVFANWQAAKDYAKGWESELIERQKSMALFRRSIKPIDRLEVQDVRFVGEQEGMVERELKAHLLSVLNAACIVERAYLARVTYGPSKEVSVALCLRTSVQPGADFLQALARVFSDMFSTDAHLDIMALDDKKEAKLSRVCSPFFESDLGASR